MSYEELEILIRALMILMFMIYASIIKPFIDSKISATEQDKLLEYTKIAVRCAEQLYTPEQWTDKKRYVLARVKEALGTIFKIELTELQIETLIEGCVNEVKKGR